MEISNELKRNLIADVENICEITLDEETKESLMRCFEITIGTHEPKFVLSEVSNNEVAYCHNCKNKCFNETMGCENYIQDFKCKNFMAI